MTGKNRDEGDFTLALFEAIVSKPECVPPKGQFLWACEITGNTLDGLRSPRNGGLGSLPVQPWSCSRLM